MSQCEPHPHPAHVNNSKFKIRNSKRIESNQQFETHNFELAFRFVLTTIAAMNKPEDEFTLQLNPRPKEKVSLDIPADTLANLKKVAASRDMSFEALLKLYIGQGLRQDLAKSFSSRERQQQRF